ncbi:MAG: FAD-dependent monooxygenase [Prolixibacteraceae bacterium]|nr:FAD-dependent monooxygenase [Prolixibacteraceae bacterium]
MGYRELNLKLPTDFDERHLKSSVAKKLHIKNFKVEIVGQSLDARQKNFIHWQVRAGVFSEELKGGEPEPIPDLVIPCKKRKKKVLVLGSGPAGFFAAWILRKAGFETTILERGAQVEKRSLGIAEFEQTGIFNPLCNYAFGEGGAGTFSDGKLTSRSKHISREKQFILKTYIDAGAPPEIAYLSHPHLGSDNLRIIVKKLREAFIRMGGVILFETMLEDVQLEGGKVMAVVTGKGIIDTDILLLAPGHSSYETYRMLMRRGVPFGLKNFALGFRAEHRQEAINLAQWGQTSLPGVKAAEYRLTSNRDGRLPVFTFCMCPGGMVAPATAYASSNIVNGMSLYERNGVFANAACVAGIHPNQLAGKEISPAESLDFLQALEESFFRFSNSYAAPYCTIADFLNQKHTHSADMATSYPMGLIDAPLWEMLPAPIVGAIADGLRDFSLKLKGYERGILLGLESKTSSPVQAIRNGEGKCENFENLYIAGEGSGYAGGIVSSAADGIRIAMGIAAKY